MENLNEYQANKENEEAVGRPKVQTDLINEDRNRLLQEAAAAALNQSITAAKETTLRMENLMKQIKNVKQKQENPTFRRDLNSAVSSFTSQARTIVAKYDYAMQNYRSGSQPMKETFKECESMLSQALSEAQRKINSAYESYLSRLDKAYTLMGSEIQNNDLALLDPSRFTFSQEEFDSLADRYEGNHTMEAALRSYAQKVGLVFFAYSKEEKRELAKYIYEEAMSWLRKVTVGYIPAYLDQMAGGMFKNACVLVE